MTKKAKDYEAAARWAEDDMVLPENSTTARRGAAAAEAGRALLARAHAGRPSLDPAAAPGTESPRRQVRLPLAVSEQVDEIAKAQGRRSSEVMRDAITLYVQDNATR
ncbi:ribbon-helix-helix protein, CopG family [Rhodococcus sp. ABRD24]|nr:ribbon-helix-helix protein, CopG family [Rhodococcus sp. ABRD24]